MISVNDYWFVFRDINKLPTYILEDTALTMCISRKYILSEFRSHSPEPYYEGTFYYSKIPNKDFYSVHGVCTIDDDAFIALVNPSDEIKTYLKLLGVRMMKVDHVPIDKIYPLEFGVVIKHKQMVSAKIK